MLKTITLILCGFICYMACTELPIPVGIEKEAVLKSKQTDTTLVNDSTGIDISITVDSSTNKIEHFIKF